jgi:hypothetical protein
MPLAKDGKAQRFYSRHFPPPGLYPENDLFRLVFLPLQVQENQAGFVALDASNLNASADIVRRLAALCGSSALSGKPLRRQLAEEANRLKKSFPFHRRSRAAWRPQA